LTHAEAAEAVGRSRASVSNLIRLLDLPEQVVALIDTKALSMGHARALLGLERDEERVKLAGLVVERGFSVRETEGLVRRALHGQDDARPAAGKPESAAVSEVFRAPGVRVQLRQKASGAGRLIVEFADAAARDGILESIKKGVASDRAGPVDSAARTSGA